MASPPPNRPVPPSVRHSLPPEEDVPPNIFAPNPLDVRRVPLSGREKATVWFATALLVLIFLICLILLWQWRVPMPQPQLTAGTSENPATESYKALTALVDERTDKFFDMTVTKTLLPVFTTLIGFLLGRRSKED